MSGKFGSVKVHILFKLLLYFSILTTILNYIFQQKWRETEKKNGGRSSKTHGVQLYFFWDNAAGSPQIWSLSKLKSYVF